MGNGAGFAYFCDRFWLIREAKAVWNFLEDVCWQTRGPAWWCVVPYETKKPQGSAWGVVFRSNSPSGALRRSL